MDYSDRKIKPTDRSEISRGPSCCGRVLAGVGAVAMTALTVGTFNYFGFRHLEGQYKYIPFSVEAIGPKGYIECRAREGKIVRIENNGKNVSLEEFLSTIPEEGGARNIYGEIIREEVARHSCSE
jgi:hypothetical protein